MSSQAAAGSSSLHPINLSGNNNNDATKKYADTLAKQGYCCIPVLSAAEIASTINQLDQECLNFPEFSRPPTDPDQYVLGGFAALANAASFHNPTVRSLREKAHKVMRPVFKELVGSATAANMPDKLEQLVDRLLIRAPGKKPSGESWHRDLAQGTAPDDLVFGGWINLDKTNQVFTGVPGTHLNAKKAGTGFALIKSNANKARYKKKAEQISIPAGHIFIFNESMVHAVMCVPSKSMIRRLFIGWRLTHSTSPLFASTPADFGNQAVMRIKSGQMPHMYPTLIWSNHRTMLVHWSQCIIPACREKRVMKTGGFAGQGFDVVMQEMPSLRVLNRLYAPYTPRELQMHTPRSLRT